MEATRRQRPTAVRPRQGDGTMAPQAYAALAPSFSVHRAYKSRQSLPFRSLSLSLPIPSDADRAVAQVDLHIGCHSAR